MIFKRTSMILSILLAMSLALAACGPFGGDDDDDDDAAPPQPEETPIDDEPTPPTEEEVTPPPEDDEATPPPDDEATPVADETPDATPEDEAAEVDGEAIFMRECAACHGEDGEGNEQAGSRIPPHNQNPLVTADEPGGVISVVLTGRGGMPRFDGTLSDEEIAAVISYIRGAWENDADPIDEQAVDDVRQETIGTDEADEDEDQDDEEGEGDETQGAGDQEEDEEGEGDDED